MWKQNNMPALNIASNFQHRRTTNEQINQSQCTCRLRLNRLQTHWLAGLMHRLSPTTGAPHESPRWFWKLWEFFSPFSRGQLVITQSLIIQLMSDCIRYNLYSTRYHAVLGGGDILVTLFTFHQGIYPTHLFSVYISDNTTYKPACDLCLNFSWDW